MEKTFDFSLSIKNLKDIPFEMYEQDFTFHLKGKNYTTTRFIADLLLPYVRQLHYSDKSRQEFYIDLEHYYLLSLNIAIYCLYILLYAASLLQL